MITYNQLIKLKGSTRKKYWAVSGSVPALIQDVIDIAKAHVFSGVASVCQDTIFCGESKPSEISRILEQPYFEDRRLVVLYDCEKIADWSFIVPLCEDSEPSTFFIFVFSEHMDDDSALHNLVTGHKLGRHVKCDRLSKNNLKDWIKSRVNIDPNGLLLLIEKSNQDYEWLLNKLRILETFEVDEIGQKMVEVVCHDEGIKQFEEALIEFDKRQCLMYTCNMEVKDVSLARISRDVRNISYIQTVAGWHSLHTRPLTDKTGLTKKQLDAYIDKVPIYNLTTTHKALSTLTTLNEGLVRGDKLTYLALICRW